MKYRKGYSIAKYYHHHIQIVNIKSQDIKQNFAAQTGLTKCTSHKLSSNQCVSDFVSQRQCVTCDTIKKTHVTLEGRRGTGVKETQNMQPGRIYPLQVVEDHRSV